MSTSDNYRIWYIIIFFLVIMIFIPPLLRIVYSDTDKKEDKTIKEEKVSNKLKLKCDKSEMTSNSAAIIEYEFNSTYNNKIIVEIDFKYKIMIQDLSKSDNVDSELLTRYRLLESIDGVNINSDGKVNIMNFVRNEKKLESIEGLGDYTKSYKEEKKFFEQLGFDCKIENIE